MLKEAFGDNALGQMQTLATEASQTILEQCQINVYLFF
jgi:hypothetical protein